MRTACLFLFVSLAASGDEGMWLFNQFPKERVQKKYRFAVNDALLDHLRLASVRMGASGSFVSPRGLIFTNHHVGLRWVQQVSTKEHNYVTDGFFAKSESDEIPCPGAEVSVLKAIEDVTGKVTGAVKAAAASAEANQQRKAAIVALEKECGASTGMRCEVVTLFAGARYHLYQYKRYTDIRLVFTPEYDLGFFGGDPDNFTYPRFCLDVNFFRAYENGKPADTPEYLKWSREGVKDGELIFVSGHPGSSSRLATVAELDFRRDYQYPLSLDRLGSLIKTLKAFGEGNPENARVARTTIFGAENSQKRYVGFLAGLKDAKLMKAKQAEESRLKAEVAKRPKLQQEYGKVWDEVAAANRNFVSFFKEYALLEGSGATGSDLFSHARTLVRLVEEREKPNDQRLREFADASMPSLERRLYSRSPVSEPMEIVSLAEYLRYLSRQLGADHPAVKAALAGRTPDAAARDYVTASRLEDIAGRKRLAASRQAVASSQDGMIRLARLLDPFARGLRKRYEDEVEAVMTSAKSKIAQVRFELYGMNEYPDATGTLRLTYGIVKGYRNKAGQAIPYATTFDGLFRRATGQEPFRLPQRWLDGKSSLDLKTPFNFAGTTDIHGGNSGSPTVNAKGEVVGILFDSNLEKLPNEFVFTDDDSRSVHVASQGIVEALRRIYRADRLLEELGVK